VMLSRGKVQESVITSVSSRDPRLLRRQAQKAHWGVGRAAGGGGEARGETSLLGDVRGMCSSAGEVRDEKNAGVGVFSRGYWLDDDLTPGYSRRAV
jgi:hypothetical protein